MTVESIYSKDLVLKSIFHSDSIKTKMADDLSISIFDVYMDNILSGGWMFGKGFNKSLKATVEGFNTLCYDLSNGGAGRIKPDKNYVMYGTGEVARYNLALCAETGLKISFLVDSNKAKWGECIEVDGRKYTVKNPDELHDIAEPVIVSSVKYKEEITDALKGMGITEERIISAGRCWQIREPQYFDFLEPYDDEVLVDVGGYTGDTALDFVSWNERFNKKYGKINIIEGDPRNIRACRENMEINRVENYKIYECLAGNIKGSISFYSDMGCGSGIYDVASSRGRKMDVRMERLDDILLHDKCTFLKIDVEGAEMEVLAGAEQLIKNNRPRIAICVYHRFIDFLVLPFRILSIIPACKMYLRHYYADFSETVLYIVPE